MKKISALAGVVIALLALFIAPDPPHPGGGATGDQALRDRVSGILAGAVEGYHTLDVAFVDGDRITSTTIGHPGTGPYFEIGSVQKV